MKRLYGYECQNFTYNHTFAENLTVKGIPPQIHDFYEIIFLKQGEVSYSIEDKIYTVRENGIIFTPMKLTRREI